jgi:excisionase family DNA binding protein
MSRDQIQTFDRKEAARLLGVSVVTVDRLLAQNLISHCKVGRRVVFQTKHISEFLARHTHKAERET